MTSANMLKSYQQVGIETRLEGASPHALIALLFKGLLEKLATARCAVDSGDVPAQGHSISQAIAIVDGLRASVDLEGGGEIATNLLDIYDFLETYLVKANIDHDMEMLNVARSIVMELSTAWDAIPEEERALVQ